MSGTSGVEAMDIRKYFKDKSLIQTSLFQNLRAVGVITVNMRENRDLEIQLLADMIRANHNNINVTPLEWGLSQVMKFYDLCEAGTVVFNLSDQEHKRLLFELAGTMSSFLVQERGDIYGVLLACFWLIMMKIRQYCIGTVDTALS